MEKNERCIEESSYDVDSSIPGFRVIARIGAEPAEVVVRAERPQEKWRVYEERPRHEDRRLHGTTIRYRERAWRIVEASPVGSGWRYRLTLWPENEHWGQVEDLSREKVEADLRRERQIRRDQRLDHVAVVYGTLVAWLPRTVQNRLAELLHFNAETASRCNAATEVLLGLYVYGLFYIYDGGYAMLGAFLWLVLEGAARWIHVGIDERPFGLFALEGLHALWRLLIRCVPGVH